MKRRPVILLIFAILFLTLLWLARGSWLPFFQNWLPQLAGDIGNQIQSIEAFVGLVVLLGGGILWLWSWFTRGEQANRRDDELTPLRATTWQTIRERSPQGARVAWIDRGVTDANQWRAQPRLALIGLSGEGKSREAAELIRRAVELEMVVESQVFEPNRDFLNTGAAITSSVLDKVVDPTVRACLFIDDLHSYAATTLEQLATLLAHFSPVQSDHRYLIATVRSDLVSPEQRDWLAQQGFHLVRLPKIDARQAEQWLTSAGQIHSLTLGKKVRQTFIAQNRQGTPGHLLRGFLTVKSTLTDNAKGRGQFKPEQVAAVMSDLEAQERQALRRRQPLAAYLLTALAHFHAAGVRTAQPLLLAYAALQQRHERSRAGRWLSRPTGRTLRRTLADLVNFDVSVQAGLIVAPDVLIEGADVDVARQAVGEFLVAYRRPFQNRLLRRCHRHAEAHRWALFELALRYQQEQAYTAATRFYTAAIQVAPHPWCYNNRGLARADQGQVADAIADYDEAIALDPQFAMAYNNRGSARQAQGDLAAIADYRKALEKAEMLPDQGLRAYRSLGAALREQAKWQEVLTIYRQALTLDDNRLSDWIALADVARHAGDEQTWQEALAQARRRLPADDAHDRACLESVAGNVEEALAALTQAAQADDFDPVWASQDPDLAWARTDSRFAEIVGKIIDKKNTGVDKLEQAKRERQVTVAETKSVSKV